MARTAPDHASLVFAHRFLQTAAPLDEMLKNPTLKIVLESVARRQMQRRSRVDVKKLQANDLE